MKFTKYRFFLGKNLLFVSSQKVHISQNKAILFMLELYA